VNGQHVFSFVSSFVFIFLSSLLLRRSARKGKNKREDVKLVEEEVYNIDEGWKIELDSTEKMMEIAGVQVPVRLRQQLEEERAQRNMPQTVVQDAPRLTHKLLRVMAGKVGGRKLVSPADMNVRPMMEVVRGAVFSILQVLHLLFLTKFLFN
jgi:hypothetical protein